MAISGVTHLGLNVASIREAEAFYVELFGMEVVLRESELPDGWSTIRPGASWDDIEAAGVEVGLSSLRAGALRIALTPGEPGPGVLNHVGVVLEPNDLAAVRARASSLGCRVVTEREDRFMFEDRFGVRWELATTDEVRSSGDALGRWVDFT